jgi:transformation/transcription domain-associated protein
VITLFSRGLHDNSLPLAVQSICVRLLLSLVEGLYGPSRRGAPEPEVRASSRELLGRILATFAAKIAGLQHTVAALMRLNERLDCGSAGPSAPTAAQDAAPSFGVLQASATVRTGGPAALSRLPQEPAKDAADAKALIKTLLLGLKTLAWSITHFDNPGSATGAMPAPGYGGEALSAEQVRSVARLFRTTPPCLRIFAEGAESSDAHEAFAAVFAVMEPRNLLDAIQLRLDDLFTAMLASGPLIQVTHALLSSASVSVHTADALAAHLVQHRLKELSHPASPSAGLVLKLWSLLLHAVTKFSDCEAVLRPHVPPLVEACLAALRTVPDPSSYVRLLRYLFRALSHAKFDALYKEFVPLLPPVLEALEALLAGPERPGLHDAAVELSLSLPARLSTLLPFLPRLMTPLVAALRGGAGVPLLAVSPELQLLGLRKLESWVDSMNPEYLEPCIADCEVDLMTALWALLRPPPAIPGVTTTAPSGPGPHALRALQLLGKLGGRGRRVLRDPTRLEWRPSPEHGLRLILTFPPSTSFLIPLDRCVTLARGALAPLPPGSTQTPEGVAHRRAAVSFLHAVVCSLLNIAPASFTVSSEPATAAGVNSFAQALQNTLLAANASTARVERVLPIMDLGSKTKAACAAEKAAGRQLVGALLCADADLPLAGHEGFALSLARHAAALCVTQASLAPHWSSALADAAVGVTRSAAPVATSTPASATTSITCAASVSATRLLEPFVILDGFLDALCEGSRPHARAAVSALCAFLDAVLLLCAARQPAVGVTAGAMDAAAAPSGMAEKQKEASEKSVPAKADRKAAASKSKRASKRGAAAEPEPASTAAAAAGAPAPMVGVEASGPDVGKQAADAASAAQIPPFMNDLWTRVLHCCHMHSWGPQLGGVAAIAALLPRLPRTFLCTHSVATARALLAVLRSLPEHAVADATDCAAALSALMSVCVPPGTPPQEEVVVAVVQVFAAELTSLSASAASRRASGDALSSLSTQVAASVADLFAPHVAPLLSPLITRPLTSRPLQAAAETAAAIAFAIAQRPPLLPPSEPLLALIGEATDIAGSDEAASLNMPFHAAADLARLRCRCLSLCSASASSPELLESSSELRARIIALFFRLLTSSVGGELVDIARDGLQVIVAQSRLPKELLQASLRPILVNLSSHKNLTLPLLAGLRRLLELLSSWFNQTLGDKLLEHLQQWTLPEAFVPSGQKSSWRPTDEISVAAALLELFHLLPITVSRFLEPLVTLSLKLEANIPHGCVASELVSPYRPPLLMFLNRHAADSAQWFLSRLDDDALSWRLRAMVCSEAGAPLLQAVCDALPQQLSATFRALGYAVPVAAPAAGPPVAAERGRGSSKRDAPVAAVAPPASASALAVADPAGRHGASMDVSRALCAFLNAVRLISAVAKLHPGWLVEASSAPLVDALLAAWQSPERRRRATADEGPACVYMRESIHLAKALIIYAQTNRADTRPLFALLSVFWECPAWDVGFVREFYATRVVQSASREERRALLTSYLQAFSTANFKDADVQANLTAGLQLIVLPMLSSLLDGVEPDVVPGSSLSAPGAALPAAQGAAAAAGGKERFLAGVLDESSVAAIVQTLLDPPEVIADCFCEALRVELLQLATALIRGAPELLVVHRKELIKFGWNHLKREDPMAKLWAFLNVATFLDAYQAPEKIILQVFVALLRTAAPESRPLVRASLDMLLPALPRRLPQGDARHPIWIRYTKKILVEEGHSTQNLVHIWQLLVRHASLFYGSRAQFVPQMVNSLSRLALPSSASSENRGLALDLAWLILHWERMRRSSATGPQASVDAPEPVPAAAMEVDAPEPPVGAAVPPSAGVKRGRAALAESLASKVARTEQPAPAQPVAAREANPVTAPPAQPVEDEFRPSTAMEDMLVNFLIRMAFLLADAKDKELVPLHKRALDLVVEALSLWPHAGVKLSYLDKLLATPPPGSTVQLQVPDPVYIIGTSLEVITRVLAAQSEAFMSAPGTSDVLLVITDAAFASRAVSVHASLAAVLAAALASPATEGVALLSTRLEELCSRTLGAAAIPVSGVPAGGGTPLAAALRLMGVLADVNPTVLDRHLATLAKLLVRLAREPAVAAASAATAASASAQQLLAARNASAESEYGSLAENTASVIALCARRVLLAAADIRSVFLRVVTTLLADRTTAPAVLTSILHAVCAWVCTTASVPPGTPGALPSRDAAELLRRLAMLARPEGSLLTPTGSSGGVNAAAEAWERPLLNALLVGCSGNDEEHAQLRATLWSQVEVPLLMGLRSRDAATRAAFLALHDRAIGRTLPARLRFILAEQEWDGAADSFWLRHAIDILCAALSLDEPLTTAPNASRLPALMLAAPLAERVKNMPGVTGAEHVPPAPPTCAPPPHLVDSVARFSDTHAAWVSSVGDMRVTHVLDPLRELTWREPAFAHHLWVLLFPISWATLAKEDQLALAKPLIALLSRDCHARQAGARVNCVQALLEGISLSHPQPKMPSELVKFLGRTFCAWHVAVPLLESHVLLFPSEPRCFDALADLYRALGEEDSLFGLWRQRAGADATRAGLALAQHGFMADAAEVFHAAAARAVRGGYASSPVSKTEMCLWESQWLATCRSLSQWEGLAEWAAGVDHPSVAAEACARLGDWPRLREALGRAPSEDALTVALLRACGALHEGAPSDAEAASAAAVRAALERWTRLPELPSPAHGMLLGSFQALMETAEAGRVLAALGGGGARGNAGPPGVHVGDVRDTLETWRGRAPCEWEPLSLWAELFTARSHVYAAAVRAPRGGAGRMDGVNESIAALGLRDQAWAATRHAAVARKHHAPDLALSLLARAPPPPQGDSVEAFARLRETVRSHLAMPSVADATTALSELESADVAAFPAAHQRAELFRLRGLLLSRLGNAEAAHAAFSAAVSLCSTASDAWLSWGEFCELTAASAAAGHVTPGARVPALWMESAVVCYLTAVRHGGAAQRYRRYLCRVLAAAGSGGLAGQAAAAALEKHADGPPVWTWVPWVPQLLLSLDRPEAPFVRELLARISIGAPQAVYYNLRSFVLEKRDVVGRTLQAARSVQAAATSTDGGAAPSAGASPDESAEAGAFSLSAQASLPPWVASSAAAVESAKEIRERLRAKHPGLVTELEAMLYEVGRSFMPQPEERLLAVVYALLHRCYKHPNPTGGEVPSSLKKELSGVCRACFSPETVAKHPDFVAAHKARFEHDLDPDASTFPQTMATLTDALRSWRTLLASAVEERYPGALRLEDESPVLRDLRPAEIELPGGGGRERERAGGACVTPAAAAGLDVVDDRSSMRPRLVRFGADVAIVRRHGTSHRRLAFLGSDGKTRFFLVTPFGSLTPAARGEERVMQLLRAFNGMLDAHAETRRRGLFFVAPAVIPVWPQVRLLEDDPTYLSYGETYDAHCARFGRDPDTPVLLFKERLNPAAAGALAGDAVLDLRLATYSEIASTIVSENLFSQFMYKTLPTTNHLWSFKRTLCSQLSLSAFVCTMLRIGGRAPPKLLFARDSGRVFQADFHPSFEATSGLCESGEPVPFRLTRNLQTFFTPFGVEGIFVMGLAAAAQALLVPRTCIDAQLALFFRDELTLWPWRRVMSSAGSQAAPPTADEVRVMATANVEEVLVRCRVLSPVPPRQAVAPDGSCPSVQRGASTLVEAALSPKNLCRMDPTWAPWF